MRALRFVVKGTVLAGSLLALVASAQPDLPVMVRILPSLSGLTWSESQNWNSGGWDSADARALFTSASGKVTSMLEQKKDSGSSVWRSRSESSIAWVWGAFSSLTVSSFDSLGIKHRSIIMKAVYDNAARMTGALDTIAYAGLEVPGQTQYTYVDGNLSTSLMSVTLLGTTAQVRRASYAYPNASTIEILNEEFDMTSQAWSSPSKTVITVNASGLPTEEILYNAHGAGASVTFTNETKTVSVYDAGILSSKTFSNWNSGGPGIGGWTVGYRTVYHTGPAPSEVKRPAAMRMAAISRAVGSAIYDLSGRRVSGDLGLRALSHGLYFGRQPGALRAKSIVR